MIELVLVLVAVILAAITLIQSRGTALLSWAVFILAVVLLLPRVA